MEKLTPKQGPAINQNVTPQSIGAVLPDLKDLKALRAQLEARAKMVQGTRIEDIKKDAAERVSLVGELNKTSPLLAEAKDDVEYLETQKSLGVLAGAEDAAQLEQLQGLVATIEAHRTAALDRYDAIMANPDVYDHVLAEAENESAGRDIVSERRAFTEALHAKIEDFFGKVERAKSEESRTFSDVQKKTTELSEAETEVRKAFDHAIERARDLNQTDMYSSLQVVRGGNQHTFGEKFGILKKQREQLGLLQGKKKAILDYLLAPERELLFKTADARASSLVEARAAMEAAKKSIEGLVDEYKSLFVDAWSKDTDLQTRYGQAYAPGHNEKLPEQAFYAMDKRFAAEEKGDKERQKTYYLYQDIRNKAGGYRLIQRPPADWTSDRI